MKVVYDGWVALVVKRHDGGGDGAACMQEQWEGMLRELKKLEAVLQREGGEGCSLRRASRPARQAAKQRRAQQSTPRRTTR